MDLHTIITNPLFIIIAVLLGVFVVVPTIVAAFLRDVEAGTVRLVSWITGGTMIYRGPGKSKEIPLLTTGTTISTVSTPTARDVRVQRTQAGSSVGWRGSARLMNSASTRPE